MTAGEDIDQQRIDYFVSEINETIDHYTKFEDDLIYERAILYTMDRVPLRLKEVVATRAMQHMREKWPHMFNEKGEPIK